MAKNKKSGSGVGFDEQFDSRLMNPKSSSDKAGALNEAKRKKTDSLNQSEKPRTLRETVITKKREKAAKEEKDEEGGGLSGMAAVPAQRATSRLLQSAWINLPDSFGLTLIWINIHVFLNLVVGERFFCKLGDEWLTGGISGGAKSINAIAQGSTGRITIKNGSKCANLGEGMVLAALDLILLLVIIIIFMIVGLLVQVVTNPMEFISNNFGWVWDVVTGAISRVVG